jgi:hypothetical protein
MNIYFNEYSNDVSLIKACSGFEARLYCVVNALPLHCNRIVSSVMLRTALEPMCYKVLTDFCMRHVRVITKENAQNSHHQQDPPEWKLTVWDHIRTEGEMFHTV